MNGHARLILITLLMMALPLAASAIVEKKTEVEYPDVVTAGCGGQQVQQL